MNFELAINEYKRGKKNTSVESKRSFMKDGQYDIYLVPSETRFWRENYNGNSIYTEEEINGQWEVGKNEF